MNFVRVVVLDHHEQWVADCIHAVQMPAYLQEAELLQATHFPPLDMTSADIQASNDHFLGAIDLQNNLMGLVSFEPEPETNQLNITSLVVSPVYQRRGIGKLLLSTAISQYKNSIITVSTGAQNLPALALYAKFGFIECMRYAVGHDHDALELVQLWRVTLDEPKQLDP
jgi:ribosomal protein S18 acetylase RimI-like enzyme